MFIVHKSSLFTNVTNATNTNIWNLPFVICEQLCQLRFVNNNHVIHHLVYNFPIMFFFNHVVHAEHVDSFSTRSTCSTRLNNTTSYLHLHSREQRGRWASLTIVTPNGCMSREMAPAASDAPPPKTASHVFHPPFPILTEPVRRSGCVLQMSA